MDIRKSEVKRITELSSISCSENELLSYMNDLSKIVDIFDKLKNVNTPGGVLGACFVLALMDSTGHLGFE